MDWNLLHRFDIDYLLKLITKTVNSVLKNNNNNDMLDHRHLIVNAKTKKPPKENDEQLVIDWIKNLIDNIGMKIIFGPYCKYCQAPGNNGITASVNIETSHCSLHVWDKSSPPILRFDLYSCAYFDVNKVLKHLDEFEIYDADYIVLDRNGDKIKLL